MSESDESRSSAAPESGLPDQGKSGEVTRLLKRWGDGDEAAADELLPLVYDDLRRIAAAYVTRERKGHTLQGTELVHEAYLRLLRAQSLNARDRGHFFSLAARTMRRILVDHARQQVAEKRVGAQRRVPLDEAQLLAGDSPEQVIEINEVLDELKARHPRPGQLVELRFFGGLSEDEASEVLQISRSTASRDWSFARLWLLRRLTGG